MPRAFAIGRNFEHRVKREFENRGYYVKRSYGSWGSFDLLCMKRMSVMRAGDYKEVHCTEVILIQCKSGPKAKYRMSKAEKAELIETALFAGAKALLVYKTGFRSKMVEVPLAGY